MYCKSSKTSQRPQKSRQKTSLFTGAISNQVRNGQTSRFASVPGQNPGRSSRGDGVELRLQSVMLADVWWRRSRASRPRIRIGQLEAFGLQSSVECSRECRRRRKGEIKRWVRRTSKRTEVFWESVTKSWCGYRLMSCCTIFKTSEHNSAYRQNGLLQ